MLKMFLFLFIVCLVYFLYSVIYNFYSKKVINQFINYIKAYHPIIFLDVKLKHISFSRTEWNVHIDKFGDIYIMEDYLVLLCKGRFIFEIKRFPLVIAKNSIFFKKNFPDFNTYKLIKVNMKHSVKREFEIFYQDERNKHYKGEIKFENLTLEQKQQLQFISEWLV